MSKKPDWKYVCNLGDKNPYTEGGIFLFEDKNKNYKSEMEIWYPETKEIYVITLEDVHDDDFFMPSLWRVANFIGVPTEELLGWLESDLIVERGTGYEALVSYFGAYEFDSYPLTDVTKYGFWARYKDYLNLPDDWYEE